MPAGACLLVIGPSGSGKSTLALALTGLVPREVPAAVDGTLLVGDVVASSAGPGVLAREVGMVFQDPSRQLVMDRVEDDVAFGLENLAWSRPAMLERVPASLAEVGLGGAERRVAQELSGGQGQRLAVAGALAPQPGVLVLDEPSANLDPDGVAALVARLHRSRAERSTTLVLIEHRVDAAWPLADVVLALDRDGSMLAVGPPDHVLRTAGERIAASGTWLPGVAGSVARASPPLAAPPIIEAADLGFAYDPARPVVQDVDLRIGEGERVALVGPNGSGKSTLARLLVGLLRPAQGRVRLGGADPWGLPARELAARAGYVFQEPERQFLTQRVRDEVLLGLPSDAVERVEPLLARLGLPLATFGDRSPYRLSGGEQRRLSLATQLLRRPAVLVLDEPTFGQDRHGYDELLRILGEHVGAGTTLLAPTHDERFIADMADRVIRLEDGRVVDDTALRRP